MGAFDKLTDDTVRGLSRRQLLGRVGGGIAGLTLGSLGLDLGPSAVAASGPTSVRDLLRRISAKGCDPSHGIRVDLPNDHPYISLRAVAGRYADKVVNYCEPLKVSYEAKAVAGGGLTVYLTGVNFTGSGMAEVSLRSDLARDNRDFSVQVRPDGTFVSVVNLGCNAPGRAVVSLIVTDAATERTGYINNINYDCPQPPPPPPPPPPPSITVSQDGSKWTVKGTGFLHSHDVTVRLTDDTSLQSFYYQTSSDGSGGINYAINAPCRSGYGLSFSASDGRTFSTANGTQELWSNTVTQTCF